MDLMYLKSCWNLHGGRLLLPMGFLGSAYEKPVFIHGLENPPDFRVSKKIENFRKPDQSAEALRKNKFQVLTIFFQIK